MKDMGGGHTTLVQRILDRRADKPPTPDAETTAATVAVMTRVLPPPKTLLVCHNPHVRQTVERRITADMLEVEVVADETEALRLFAAEFRPVIVTDSLEFIRKLRSRNDQRRPFICYVPELDEAPERDGGLTAGADQCVAYRVSARELDARLTLARRVAELESVLRITLAENRSLSSIDELTRVSSRRFFGKNFPREVARAARYGRALALILCDIDHFSRINEKYGHLGGDEILRQLSVRLQEGLRKNEDWIARIGGEEFAIVLPETGSDAGREVARKLRRRLADSPFKLEGGSVQLTASFGLCGADRVPAGERNLASRIMKLTDAALYRSKQDGRNRVTAAVLNAESA